MSYTTDRNDPDLGHGVDSQPIEQHKKYLILSEEERAKGFIRPVRSSYIHVGSKSPKYPLIELTDEEKKKFSAYNWIAYEKYPDDPESSTVGKYWTQAELDNKGCKTVTTMSLPLAETYARNPKFYGSTYCLGCRKHLLVSEFLWLDTNEEVGS